MQPRTTLLAIQRAAVAHHERCLASNKTFSVPFYPKCTVDKAGVTLRDRCGKEIR